MRRLSIILFFVLAVSEAYANKTFQAIYFKKPAEAPSSLYCYANGELLKDQISLSKRQFSRSVKIGEKGDVILHFTDRELEDAELKEGALAPYPSVVIPEGWSKFLLIAFEDPNNKVLPIKMQPINADGNFKEGSIMVVNTLSHKVSGSIGSAKVNIEPKNFSVIKEFANGVEDYRMDLKILYPERKDRQEQTFIFKLLKNRPNARLLLFTYQVEGSQRPRYHSAEIKNL